MGNQELIIIGNGFDLQAGLKSTFSDFYKSRYNVESLDRIDRQWETQILKNNRNVSIWDLLICTYVQNDLENLQDWRDVESVISEVLRGISNNNKIHFVKNIFSDVYMIKSVTNVFVDLLNGESSVPARTRKTLKDYFMAYYIIEALSRSYPDFKNWINAKPDYSTERELEEGDESSFFNGLNFNQNSTQILAPFLLKELRKFESAFSEYLNEELQKNTLYRSRVNKLFQIMTEGTTSSEFQVLSFNYTAQNDNERFTPEYRNIHGSLKHNNIIFGIDSSDLVSDKGDTDVNLVKFTKTSRILKLTNNSLTNKNSNWKGQQISKIIIYGHSLGEADYSYFQSIFDSVNLYQSKTKLVFAYSIYDLKKSEEIETTYETSVEKLMYRYGQSFSNQSHGRNLLHKLLLEDRIEIRLITSHFSV
ncbi:hypothetical protein CRI85_04150 [Leuconostoc pseudomesenteroides]|uniref:AbiH family protein n=1 Tax=Leuconostoc pseudomesenteroides TaxID=33968 RepID=UPI001E3BEF0C|nr:AbiH family protein [Leuconostoc pseudomesenteroides]MCC8439536.1 hypothetical protein [Leuconostoc pseudomesenteroides]